MGAKIMRFKLGDLVRLKSGGPTMTIRGIDGDQYDCTWFNDKHIQQAGFFYDHELESAEDDPRPPAMFETL